MNPTNKQKKQGKRALIKLLDELKDYDIEERVFLKLVTKQFQEPENKELFKSFLGNAKNLKITDYKIKSFNLIQDSVFEIITKIDYDYKIDHVHVNKLSISCSIRISPEPNGIYLPTTQFVKESHVNALRNYKNPFIANN